jgi:hypothetical protein
MHAQLQKNKLRREDPCDGEHGDFISVRSGRIQTYITEWSKMDQSVTSASEHQVSANV